MNICASTLMAPTQYCWNIVSEPPHQSLLQRIKQAVTKPFACLGVLFTMPLFFLGGYLQLILWPIDLAFSFIPTVHPNFLQIDIYPQHPEVREDFRNLQRLKLISEHPTRRNYENLPDLQRYLIAAKYTYPRLQGWYFTSKEEIKRIFIGTIREDLSHAGGAIREAITSQEGIIFARTLKRELQAGNYPQALINDGQYHFNKIARRMVRRLENRGDLYFAKNFIRDNPTDLRIDQVLNEEIRHLTNGY